MIIFATIGATVAIPAAKAAGMRRYGYMLALYAQSRSDSAPGDHALAVEQAGYANNSARVFNGRHGPLLPTYWPLI